jgi:uncharacterized Zn-finger protein
VSECPNSPDRMHKWNEFWLQAGDKLFPHLQCEYCGTTTYRLVDGTLNDDIIKCPHCGKEIYP